MSGEFKVQESSMTSSALPEAPVARPISDRPLFREKYARESVDLNHRLEELKAAVGVYEALSAWTIDKERLCGRRVKLRQTIESIQTDISKLQSTLAAAQRKKEPLENTIRQLESEIQKNRAEIELFLTQKSAAEAEVSGLSEELSRLTEQKIKLEASQGYAVAGLAKSGDDVIEETLEVRLSRELKKQEAQFKTLKESLVLKVEEKIASLEAEKRQLVSDLADQKANGDPMIAGLDLELRALENTHQVKITELEAKILLLRGEIDRLNAEIIECEKGISALPPLEEASRERGKTGRLFAKAKGLVGAALTPSKGPTETRSVDSDPKVSREEALKGLNAQKASLLRDIQDLKPQLEVLEKQLGVTREASVEAERALRERNAAVITPLREQRKEMKSHLATLEKKIRDHVAFLGRLSPASAFTEGLICSLPDFGSRFLSDFHETVKICIKLRKQLEEMTLWKPVREVAPSPVVGQRTEEVSKRVALALAKRKAGLTRKISLLEEKRASVEQQARLASDRAQQAHDGIETRNGMIDQRESQMARLVSEIQEIETGIQKALSERSVKESMLNRNSDELVLIQASIEAAEVKKDDLKLPRITEVRFREQLRRFSKDFESEPYSINVDTFDFTTEPLSKCVGHLFDRWNEAQEAVEKRLLEEAQRQAAAEAERQAAEAERQRQAAEAERQRQAAEAERQAAGAERQAAVAPVANQPPRQEERTIEQAASPVKKGWLATLKAALVCLLYLFICGRKGRAVSPAVAVPPGTPVSNHVPRPEPQGAHVLAAVDDTASRLDTHSQTLSA